MKNSAVQLRLDSRKVLKVESVNCGAGFALLRTAVYKRQKANLRFSRISKWRPKCVKLLFCTNPGAFLSMSTEEEMQTQNDRLELLLNLTSKITSSLDLREVLRAVAANIREVIHAEGVTVSLQDAASEKFRVFAIDFPHGKGVLKEELLVRPSTAVKKALETLRPVVSHTCDGHEDIVVAEGLRAYCAIPLVNRGRALGILSILRTTEAPFSQEDMNFLSRASGQIAIAIENACAYHEISQLKDKLAQEKLYLEEEIRSEMSFENIIGSSPALKHV